MRDKQAYILALLPVAIVSLSVALWYLKPLEGEVFSGFSQWEQPQYLAISREVVDGGGVLFYRTPYASELDFPRIYSHLLFIILGHLWNITGLSLTTLWWLTRIIFGPIMFYLTYKILAEYISNQKYLTFGYLMIMFGGGLAYFHAFFGSLFTESSFMENWLLIEAPYDWWFTNLFRVTFYPLEIFAHVMFFSSLYFFIKKNGNFSLLFFFLTWWTHPITGATLTAIYGLYFLSERLFYEQKLLKDGIPFAFVSIIFLFYYFIFIPSFPQALDLSENWKLLQNAAHLNPLLYPSAWGIFLFLPLFLGKEILQDQKKRLLLYWAFAELVLINNDMLLVAYEPMHFTRGNFFFPLAVLSALAVQKLFNKNKHQNLILISLLFIAIVDNTIFIGRFISVGGESAVIPNSRIDPLRLKNTELEVIQALQKVPTHETVLLPNAVMDVLTPAFTHHNTLLGPPNLVPFYSSKLKEAQYHYQTLDPRVLEKYNISIVVYPVDFSEELDRDTIIYRNDDFVMTKS
jgi:hypothetical protein